MRNSNLITVLVAGGLTLATTNLKAQSPDYRSPSTLRPDSSQTDAYSNPATPAQPWAAVKASSIIGQPVQTDSGERLGTVKDLIVNLQRPSVPYAIIQESATASATGTRVAVPLTALRQSGSNSEIILHGTKAQFDAASTMPTGEWTTIVGPNWNSDVDRFYGRPTAAGWSRYERQEMLLPGGERQGVRTPSERKGATDLQPQVNESHSGIMRTPNQLTDEQLMTKINDLVRQDQAGQPGNVQVSLKKGVVTLSGAVPNDAQKKQLENQIKALPGVDRVEDHLIVENQ